MMPEQLSEPEKALLLGLAREALAAAAGGSPEPEVDLEALSERLRAPGVTFVTLTEVDGSLRGCVGALEAYQPLAEDVIEHATAAALYDYRFLPVTAGEVDGLRIEISRLSAPVPLSYDCPEDLPLKLRPGIDGVLLRDGARRATFLPQVWEHLPDPEAFLAHLCQKMGAPPDDWKKKRLSVSTYTVEEFHETA